MSRVSNVVQQRKPKPEFADLWDALVKQHTHELAEIPKTIDVPVPPGGDVSQYVEHLKPALETRFEEIDRTYEQRFLALAQSVAWETREEMERRMDVLARLYAETHDPKVKAELEQLSRWLAELTKS